MAAIVVLEAVAALELSVSVCVALVCVVTAVEVVEVLVLVEIAVLDVVQKPQVTGQSARTNLAYTSALDTDGSQFAGSTK